MSVLQHDQDQSEAEHLMDEDVEAAGHEKLFRCTHRSSYKSSLLHILFILAASFGLYSLARNIWTSLPTTRISCNCGDSIAEATALSCIFDPIASAYLPPHCRDDELIEQFNSAGPGINGSWQYYSDPNKTTAYTYSEVAALADTNKVFWATLRWHIVHCSYNWRKQFRRSVTGVQLEKRFDTIGHLEHCEKIFQRSGDLEEVVTHAPVALHADDGPLG